MEWLILPDFNLPNDVQLVIRNRFEVVQFSKIIRHNGWVHIDLIYKNKIKKSSIHRKFFKRFPKVVSSTCLKMLKAARA